MADLDKLAKLREAMSDDGRRIHPDDLLAFLTDEMGRTEAIEAVQVGIERGFISLDSGGYVIRSDGIAIV